MKRYVNPFRVASLLLALFCLGHTLGALVAPPQFGAASDAVVGPMRSVHFDVAGSDCTWFGFYLGNGYQVSIFLLFSAVLTWFLGGLGRADQRRWAPITWALFASYAGAAVAAVHWLFVVPIVFSSLITVVLGIECLRALRPLNPVEMRDAKE